ncbi:hypothetical protein [Paenibacillus sp. NAIST15-1]|uniref:hypothetical protein n=1 Tax=Paenibacillus sp. NAIST15-1 TaxID=1605994 RepID=UPI000A495D43|nr:hypothetical protein [Paenibacillus sp. NAIST15-1]
MKTLQNEDKEHIREKLLKSAEYRIGSSVAKEVLAAMDLSTIPKAQIKCKEETS